MTTDDILKEFGREFVVHCTDESMIDAIFESTYNFRKFHPKDLVLERFYQYGSDMGVRLYYNDVYGYCICGWERIRFYRERRLAIIEFDDLYSKRNEECYYEVKDDDFFRLLGATD